MGEIEECYRGTYMGYVQGMQRNFFGLNENVHGIPRVALSTIDSRKIVHGLKSIGVFWAQKTLPVV